MPFIQAFRTKRRLGIPRVGVGMLIIRCWGRVQRCGLVLNGLTPCIRWWIIATPIIWNPPGKISLWATPSGGTQEAPGILWSTWCEQSLWEHTLRQKRKMRLPLKKCTTKEKGFHGGNRFLLVSSTFWLPPWMAFLRSHSDPFPFFGGMEWNRWTGDPSWNLSLQKAIIKSFWGWMGSLAHGVLTTHKCSKAPVNLCN